VRPARESNVINITYKGSEPEAAANIANAFAQAYLDINLALKTEPARIYAEWFDEQTKASRAKLEEAQARLSDYQQKAGIVSSDERVDYETTKLAEISSQLTTVQGETTDSQSKRGSRGDTVAEVMQSPLINGLKADVARQEAKVQEVSVRLGENHPERQRAESELAALKSRLASETARINASIETTYRVGKDRERELQGAVGAQKARVLALNKQRDELNVYRRDVESAQRAYEAVSQSASQTRLQSLSNQTNVVRLNVATPPVRAVQPAAAGQPADRGFRRDAAGHRLRLAAGTRQPPRALGRRPGADAGPAGAGQHFFEQGQRPAQRSAPSGAGSWRINNDEQKQQRNGGAPRSPDRAQQARHRLGPVHGHHPGRCRAAVAAGCRAHRQFPARPRRALRRFRQGPGLAHRRRRALCAVGAVRLPLPGPRKQA
jgi:capsule polysaccharide export protein KpsE/RkpR